MRRLLMVSAVAALMAAMMVASAAPAMANERGDRFDNNLGHFGVFNGLDRFDPRFDNGLGLFDEDEEELDTIDVGDFECLVEDGDDIEFCVNEETGEKISNV